MMRLNAGKTAESKACNWLLKQGMVHRESNFRTRWGEIDLIMQDGETVVFVEVRYRSNSQRFGGALESIDAKKIARLVKTSKIYIQQKRIDAPCRFDVVTLDGDRHIDWIPNAFGDTAA